MHSCGERMCQRLVGKCVADLAEQRVAREWLLEVEFLFQKLLAVFVLFNIARHVDNLQIREETFQPLDEVRPAHIGHHHIRYQEMDRLAQAVRNLQRFGPILSRNHPVARRSQEAGRQLPNFLLVLHKKHGFKAASGRNGNAVRGSAVYLLANSRQVNLEPSSFAWRTVHPDEAVTLHHDAVHGRKTEPGSFSWLLGGEKWLKDSRLR